jgi:hypothetical protein
MSGDPAFRWARRVRPELIRRLYELDAKGVQDDELLNEAGYAIYARCESIRIATEAHFGRLTCRKCRAIIPHHGGKDTQLVCGECGWSTTWAGYHTSYKRQQLHGGKAYPDFLAFLERWPAARTYRDKLLEIDRLVHALHVDAKYGFARPAAVNILEVTMREARELMQELAYGTASTPGLAETRASWQETTDSMLAAARERIANRQRPR